MDYNTKSFWLGEEDEEYSHYITSKYYENAKTNEDPNYSEDHPFWKLYDYIAQDICNIDRGCDMEVVEVPYFANYIIVYNVTKKQAKKIHDLELRLRNEYKGRYISDKW